jgi:D-arabinose 1-dehydrogenase-like Zn-dependent alcohol dehydrogenase
MDARSPPQAQKAEAEEMYTDKNRYYTPGTFAQYALAPTNYVTPIPDGLDSADAAPMLCAGLTVYSALLKCGAKAGDWYVCSFLPSTYYN